MKSLLLVVVVFVVWLLAFLVFAPKPLHGEQKLTKRQLSSFEMISEVEWARG